MEERVKSKNVKEKEKIFKEKNPNPKKEEGYWKTRVTIPSNQIESDQTVAVNHLIHFPISWEKMGVEVDRRKMISLQIKSFSHQF